MSLACPFAMFYEPHPSWYFLLRVFQSKMFK